MIQFVLKLISPAFSEKDTEALVAWVMGYAETVGHNQERINDKALPPATLHQFTLAFQQPDEPDLFHQQLFKQLLNKSFPAPLPYAVSMATKQVAETPKRLVVFDMDSTVINQEVIDEIARRFGLYDEVAAITEEAMQGQLDFKQSLARRCELLKGMPFSKAESILAELTLSPGADLLIDELHSRTIKTAIVSGGFDFVLKYFQQQLLVDEVHGHHLHRDSSGALLGTVEAPIIDAERKKHLVSEMKQKYQATFEQTVTIGDGANDMLMMGEAGTSVSFCGKPKLAEVCNTLILQRNLLWLKYLI
jgi:phosphoserine phosphatase